MIIGEARSWVAEVLPTQDALPAASRAELLSTALVSALEVGDATAARATSERLAALLGDVDDPYLDAVSRLLLSWAAALVGDLDGARRGLRTVLDRLHGLGEPMWTGLALVTAGSVEAALGDSDDALHHAAEAHDLAGRFDTPWLAAVSRVVLAGLAMGRRHLDEARALLCEALDVSVSGHNTHCLCLALAGTSALSLADGDDERAGPLAGATDGLRRRAGLGCTRRCAGRRPGGRGARGSRICAVRRAVRRGEPIGPGGGSRPRPRQPATNISHVTVSGAGVLHCPAPSRRSTGPPLSEIRTTAVRMGGRNELVPGR